MLDALLSIIQIFSAVMIIIITFFRPNDDDLHSGGANPLTGGGLGMQVPKKIFLPLDKIIAFFVVLLFASTIFSIRLENSAEKEKLTIEKIQDQKETQGNQGIPAAKEGLPVAPPVTVPTE